MTSVSFLPCSLSLFGMARVRRKGCGEGNVMWGGNGKRSGYLPCFVDWLVRLN